MPVFKATYQLQADSMQEAEDWAKAVAREQTIECIDEGVPHAWILGELLGQVLSVMHQGDRTFVSRISFNADITGNEMPQLMNVLYGNTSIHVGVKLVGLDFDPEVLAPFPGPQFGIEGIRRVVGRKTGPLLCTVLKPMGQTPDELAELAYQSALGEADMIKDDHSLSMQKWAPFQSRVETIAKAVAKANAQTGRNTIYAPSMLCPIDKIEERATFAVGAGAGGYLLMPGHTSWDSIRFLASRSDLSLPIMCHPSGIGTFCNSEANGMSHQMMYAAYPRLAGADVSIYPSYGGRYGFSRELCVQVAEDCLDPRGMFRPILPSPGGGMRLEIAKTQFDMYGNDALYLFGGAAMKYRDRIADGLKEIRTALA